MELTMRVKIIILSQMSLLLRATRAENHASFTVLDMSAYQFVLYEYSLSFFLNSLSNLHNICN